MEAYCVGDDRAMGGSTWLRGSFFHDFRWSRLAYCRSAGEGFWGRGGGVELLSLLVVLEVVREALGCSSEGEHSHTQQSY